MPIFSIMSALFFCYKISAAFELSTPDFVQVDFHLHGHFSVPDSAPSLSPLLFFLFLLFSNPFIMALPLLQLLEDPL